MWSSPSQGLSLLNIIILAVRQAIYIQCHETTKRHRDNTHRHTHTERDTIKENRDIVGQRVVLQSAGLQGPWPTEKICCQIQGVYCPCCFVHSLFGGVRVP